MEKTNSFEVLKRTESPHLNRDINLIEIIKQQNPEGYKQYEEKSYHIKQYIMAKVKAEIISSLNYKFNQAKNKKEELWNKLLLDTNGICPDCKQYVGIELLTKDHIVPQSKGGRDVIENLQPLCLPCNVRKSNKIVNKKIIKKIIEQVGLKKGYKLYV